MAADRRKELSPNLFNLVTQLVHDFDLARSRSAIATRERRIGDVLQRPFTFGSRAANRGEFFEQRQICRMQPNDRGLARL